MIMGDDKSTIDSSASVCQPLSVTNIRDLVDSVDAFLFDCDGVIWKGDTLIDGVAHTLEMLRSKGKKLVFVTNNSTKSRKQYANKFQSLGIPVTEEEIFSSSFAAAMYLKINDFPPEKKVYVIGGEGIIEELKLAGFTGLGGPEDGKKTVQLKANTLFEHDRSIGAVVVGLDQYLNYYSFAYKTPLFSSHTFIHQHPKTKSFLFLFLYFLGFVITKNLISKMVCMPMKRSREGEYDTNITNMANYLMLLSRGTTSSESYDVNSVNRVFECKTCNRQFPSFQALGGHRASHKRPRLVDGEVIDHHDNISPSKPKTHKCSICGLEFAIGQALGGHMRRHRAATDNENHSPAPLNLLVPVVKKVNSRRVFSLDLNLTPLENDFGFRVDHGEKATPITVDFFL